MNILVYIGAGTDLTPFKLATLSEPRFQSVKILHLVNIVVMIDIIDWKEVQVFIDRYFPKSVVKHKKNLAIINVNGVILEYYYNTDVNSILPKKLNQRMKDCTIIFQRGYFDTQYEYSRPFDKNKIICLIHQNKEYFDDLIKYINYWNPKTKIIEFEWYLDGRKQ